MICRMLLIGFSNSGLSTMKRYEIYSVGVDPVWNMRCNYSFGIFGNYSMLYLKCCLVWMTRFE